MQWLIGTLKLDVADVAEAPLVPGVVVPALPVGQFGMLAAGALGPKFQS